MRVIQPIVILRRSRRILLTFLVCGFFALLRMTGAFAQSLPKFSDYFSKSEWGPVQTKESKHFQVSWVHPGDGVLVDPLLVHLELAHQDLQVFFKDKSEDSAKVPVEIYPDLKSFSAVSGLSLARFKATGTIALTLEQRLMQLSPRNLVTGYSWAETTVHEYAHYLIREISPERIPIWLHEGTAQLFQGYPYSKKPQISPSQWGLFKKAKKSKSLLSLETLKEPFPYRKSPGEAELAYVEALLFAEWLDKKCQIVQLIRWTESFGSLEKALQKCTGFSDQQLHSKFLTEIMASVEVPSGKEVEFFARDFSSSDPLEAEGKKVDQVSRNHAQLASELFKQERYRATILEMKDALSKTPVKPPSWRRQLAMAYGRLKDDKNYSLTLEELLKDYPQDAAAWFLKGAKLLDGKNSSQSWDSFLRAFYINPYLEGLQESMKALKEQNPNFDYRLK